MKLFEVVNYKVQFSAEALMLKPFHALWERDPSPTKELANAELAAVYFFTDFKSDFVSILDEEDKLRQIKATVKGLPREWQPDATFNSAVAFYKERSKTATSELYEGALIGVSKLDKFLRNVSFAEKDKSGKPIHNAKQINDTIKSLVDTVKKVKELEDIVKKEQETKNSLRGGRTKGMYAD